MEKFALLTPNRGGEREQLLKFCREQVERFHFKAPHYVINHHPETEQCDLIPRVKKGIAMAKAEGIDWICMVESDDFYPNDYLDRIIPYMATHDFIGDESSIYFNLRNRTYAELPHPGRASLFTTSFRVSALDNFKWPAQTSPYLDMSLWEHARKGKRCKFVDSGAIGIKTNTGKVGGNGHRKTFKNSDPELKWLEENTDVDSFEFYKNLQLDK